MKTKKSKSNITDGIVFQGIVEDKDGTTILQTDITDELKEYLIHEVLNSDKVSIKELIYQAKYLKKEKGSVKDCVLAAGILMLLKEAIKKDGLVHTVEKTLKSMGDKNGEA